MAPTSGLSSMSMPVSQLVARDSPSTPPLASVFALIMSGSGNSLSSRSIESLSSFGAPQLNDLNFDMASSLHKRQQAILVIPTTYKGLNAGPAPGSVVGIVLGSIAGFILALMILLVALKYSPMGYRFNREVFVEEEKVIRRRTRSRSTRRKSASVFSAPSEIPVAPKPASRRESRQTRRESRRESRVSRRQEEVVVEEDLESEPAIIEVIEEPSTVHSDDVVEVIEEHSPAPDRRQSRRSGYRTVDPAEFGGGNAPANRISRNSRRSPYD